MSPAEIKSSFHSLIDEFKNEEVLEKMYDIMTAINNKSFSQKEDWWDLLCEEHKKRINDALKYIDDESKWISNEKVMRESLEWLKK